MPQLVCYPIGIDTGISVYKEIKKDISNAVGKPASNTGSYAEWSMITGGASITKMYWMFDVSSIPANAIITNVTCTARCYASNSQITRGGNSSFSLCVGNERKVYDDDRPFGTTAKEITLSSAEFTRAELDNLRMNVQCARGFFGTSTEYTNRLYGATLTIDYEVPTSGMYVYKNGKWVRVIKYYYYVDINGDGSVIVPSKYDFNSTKFCLQNNNCKKGE